MPRIPEIGYSTRPVGPTQQPTASAGALSATGRGMQQVGGALQRTGATIQDIQEKQALFEADLQYFENEKTVLDTFEEAKRNAPEGAEGFTEEVQSRFNDWLPEAMDQAPAMSAAQKHLQLRYTQLGESLTQSARQFEARSRAERDTRRMAVLQDGMANEARTNPNDLDTILAKSKELVDSVPFWNEQQRGKVNTQLRQQIFNSSLDGWVTNYEVNPVPLEDIDAAISALKSNFRGYKDEVDSGVYDQALTRLENRKKSVENESKAVLGKDLQDTLAAIEVNGPAADPGFITEERLSKVYPDQPELAQRITQQIASAKKIYNVKQRAVLTTPQEDAQTLAALKSAVSGRGAQFEKQNYQTMWQALQQKWGTYAKDPVAYLLQADPSLAKDMKEAEISKDPEDFSLLLDRMDGMQARMGTPPWRREYMGGGAAQKVAEKLTGMGAEDAANVMEQLQIKYQNRWPQVMRELEKQHIDPRFMVLGRLDSKQDASLRKELAAAFQAGSANLKKNIGDINASDIDGKVAKKMPSFNATLANAERTGQEIISRETAAIKTLAYQLYSRGDITAEEAATKAFNLLLGNRYDFGPSYRTPKGEIGTVEQAAGVTLNQLRPEQFAPAGGAPMPGGVDKETEMAYRRQAAYTAAVKMGKWLNTPMGDGIMLFKQDDSRGIGYSPVELEDGSNVIIKFKDAGTIVQEQQAKQAEEVGRLAP